MTISNWKKMAESSSKWVENVVVLFGKGLTYYNTMPHFDAQTSPFLLVCSISYLKTLWEKEKLLVTSNFSFSHSVFYPFGEPSAIFIQFEIGFCRLFQIWRVLNWSFGKELRYIALENIVRKGEIARNKQFLLFSQSFLPYMALIILQFV